MVSVNRITLRVGASRKEGTGDYGSVGASCEAEVEIHGGATPAEIMEVRDQYLSLCECTVDDELARQRAAAGAAPRPSSAPAAADCKPRSTWGSADRGEAARRTDGRTGKQPAAGGDAPQTGRALFARLKDHDEANGTELGT